MSILVRLRNALTGAAEGHLKGVGGNLCVFSSATSGAAVTPSDVTVLDFHALWVGSVGNVAVLTRDGTTLSFANVASGTLLPVSGTKVLATGTTASGIVGLKW